MNPPSALPSVDVAQADRRLREDPARPVLLDVREPNEFVAVRIPGAMLLPTSTVTTRLDELPPDRPLFVICRTGVRSAAVTGFLARNGRTEVFNVTGGMDAWEGAGLPIRRGPVEPGEGAPPAG
ncbi:MAG: rhodanese-like domain-containing protein [Chloroflexota bacterium]